MATWREIARPIIAKVIAENGDDGGKLKRALFEAYPFGQRKHFPYKVWLDEIKIQTGRKPVRSRKTQTPTMAELSTGKLFKENKQ